MRQRYVKENRRTVRADTETLHAVSLPSSVSQSPLVYKKRRMFCVKDSSRSHLLRQAGWYRGILPSLRHFVPGTFIFFVKG